MIQHWLAFKITKTEIQTDLFQWCLTDAVVADVERLLRLLKGSKDARPVHFTVIDVKVEGALRNMTQRKLDTRHTYH